MKRLLFVLMAALVSIFAASIAYAQSETPIPRSVQGDKGKYYLLESKKSGNIVRVLHKRIGLESVGFTRTETNCKTRQMREIGYGEGTAQNIKIRPTEWFELVPGSSRSDLAHFICEW
ncbi:hypothetical protein [Nitrosovibrio sp. Nv4]|uniref:hypothetical protein n=1 Tax=Nitrosovibrio sp. Nv4 TaxID=1945880 RepID=UPI000BDC16EE|nr:hypothetical protein [Nitrosovibrio sp. Nv4]SOD41939.1 hypothetical protein SAMN06298226_2257 [Nitrosovibrio sp. Nv4]